MQFLLLTTNRFGVLSRITSVVSSFGANIDTVSVYPVGDSGNSIVCFTLTASDTLRQRLHRKLSRLIDVIEISSGLESDLRFAHPNESNAGTFHAKAGLS
jgi:acetolactate synthase small subunit